MRECFDEGILQSYCDSELAPEMAERVASHLASCAVCLQAVSEVESENELLSQGLEAEFALSVPTERLRQRVDAAIAGLPVAGSSRTPASIGWLQSIADLFKVSPQRAFAFASVAVVLIASIFAMVQYKNRQAAPINPEVAQRGPAAVPATSPEKTPVVVERPSPPQRVSPTPDFVQAGYHLRRNPEPRPSSAPEVKLLPGERSYLKTIAALDSTIKAEGNKPMRPALQSEYERNLAMVDRAIAATRSAAKSNPNDPDAAEFMFAAYQTKVDFLNQVADSRLSNGRH
jgi:anti-sigma factor RsiW